MSGKSSRTNLLFNSMVKLFVVILGEKHFSQLVKYFFQYVEISSRSYSSHLINAKLHYHWNYGFGVWNNENSHDRIKKQLSVGFLLDSLLGLSKDTISGPILL